MNAGSLISTRYAAGALAYALFTVVVSSMILSAIILGVYYSQIEYLTARNANSSLLNISSAVNLSLALEGQQYHVPERLQLYSVGEDSVEITRQPWGLWDVVKVQSRTKRWQRETAERPA